jgi:hypothetical protein
MGLIENVLSWFYQARTQDFVVYPFAPDQIGEKHDAVSLKNQYLRVELRSMWVTHVQKGLTKFYGMVNSHIAVPHLREGDAEFQTMVCPPELKDVDAASIVQFISFNQPLAGPVPYRGGDVRLQIGLFSVAAANVMAPYISLLEEISSKCSIEFINLALPYVGLLSKGVSLLTGSNNAKVLEIGISTTLADPRRTALLVMRANRADFPDSRLRKLVVTTPDSRLLENGKPLTEFPHMILRIAGKPNRDDWFKIPELKSQHDSFVKALRGGDANEVKPALIALTRYLRTCPDLLRADADAIAKEATVDADDLYPETATGIGRRKEPRTLEEYRIYT